MTTETTRSAAAAPEIRAATPDEHDAIGALVAQSYRDGGELTDGSDYELVLHDVAQRAKDSTVLVARRGHDLVGSVTVMRPGDAYAELALPGELEFRFLAVSRSAWGTGVSDALVRAVLRQADDERLDTVMFERDGNRPAHLLYARHGFKPIPDRDFEPVPGVRLHAMVRRIRP